MKYSVFMLMSNQTLVCFVGLSAVKCSSSCQTRYLSVCYEMLCLHAHLRPCIGLFCMCLLTSTMNEVGCSISTSILNVALVYLLWNTALSLCLLQFTARWYLCVWESQYVLLPISQKCPQHCLWNSSSSGLTLWCLSSQFIHRHYFPAVLQYKAHTHACTHAHTNTQQQQQHPITSHVTVFHIHFLCLKCCPQLIFLPPLWHRLSTMWLIRPRAGMSFCRPSTTFWMTPSCCPLVTGTRRHSFPSWTWHANGLRFDDATSRRKKQVTLMADVCRICWCRLRSHQFGLWTVVCGCRLGNHHYGLCIV